MSIWEENGYLNVNGKPVANRVGVEKLEVMVRDAEEEGRLRVKFWLVGKSENRDGVKVAEEAFERYVFFNRRCLGPLCSCFPGMRAM